MHKKAHSIDEFCELYGISRAFLYKLWDNGLGPRYSKVGQRRLIGVEAGEEWFEANASVCDPQTTRAT